MEKRVVYLGTKPVDSLDYVATHWAIRVGNDCWWEIDGGSGNVESSVFKNTINTGLWEIFPTKKIQKGPVGKVHRGEVARSGAKVLQMVGNTTKSNDDIDAFNEEYLQKNPEYSFTLNNCQHYVYKLVNMLVGDTMLLPMLETRKAAIGVGIGTVVGVAAFAAVIRWFSPSEKSKEADAKEKRMIEESKTKLKNES